MLHSDSLRQGCGASRRAGVGIRSWKRNVTSRRAGQRGNLARQYGSGEDSYGKEANAELLVQMENHRDDMIVIAARYPGELDRFLATNAGRGLSAPRPGTPGPAPIGGRGGRVLTMAEKLPRKVYEQELLRLQAELVKLQEWVRVEKQRLVVIFEGRDAAGKGSTIKRITEYLNPRVARIVALPRPDDRERGQWYFQRYVEQLPAGGEIVLMDRSWYNRAGVEWVMGFCSNEEHRRFLHQCPIFERLLVEDGILLRKYWFSVSDTEQERRIRARLDDPVRRWKLSTVDLQSIENWDDYSRAKDEMLLYTDIPEAPWSIVDSDDKRRARINMISHLLDGIPYHEVSPPALRLPERPPPTGYRRPEKNPGNYVPDHAATL